MKAKGMKRKSMNIKSYFLIRVVAVLSLMAAPVLGVSANEEAAQEELDATQTAALDTSVAASAPGATVAASVEDVKPEAKKKWGATYLTEVFQPTRDFHTNNYDRTTYYNMVSGSYQISDSERVDLRQYFDGQSTSNDGRDDFFTMGDVASQYSNSKFGSIGDQPVALAIRGYIPVSKASRDTGRYQLRITGSTEQSLTDRLKASYLLQARNYAYSEDSRGQLSLRTLAEAGLTYGNGAVKPIFSLGADNRFYRTTRGGKRAAENQVNLGYYSVGLRSSLGGGISLITSYLQDYDFASGDDFKPFTDNRGFYNLLFVASI